VKLNIVNAVLGATSLAVFKAFQFACLGITAFLALSKTIPIGDVVLYQSFFVQIIGAVNFILAIYPQIYRGYDAFVSLGDIVARCTFGEAHTGRAREAHQGENYVHSRS
jgi:ATP-binding cassette subfamily B protein